MCGSSLNMHYLISKSCDSYHGVIYLRNSRGSEITVTDIMICASQINKPHSEYSELLTLQNISLFKNVEFVLFTCQGINFLLTVSLDVLKVLIENLFCFFYKVNDAYDILMSKNIDHQFVL